MLKTRMFKSMEALTRFAAGGVLGGVVKHQTGYPIGGMSLAFDHPNYTITFGGVGALSFRDLAHQVYAQSSGEIRCVAVDGCLAFVEEAPSTGIVIATGPQPVLAHLGMDPAGGQEGKVLNPMGSAYGPYYVSVSQREGGHVLVFDDADSTAAGAPLAKSIQVDNPSAMVSDLEISPATRAVWVGGGGNLKVMKARDTVAVTYVVPAGVLIPMSIVTLYKVGTTATLLILEK